MQMGEETADGVLARLAFIEPPCIHHHAIQVERSARAVDLGVLDAEAAEPEAGRGTEGPPRHHRDAGER
jgi:hypothetical protein